MLQDEGWGKTNNKQTKRLDMNERNGKTMPVRHTASQKAIILHTVDIYRHNIIVNNGAEKSKTLS